jgi:hypothetical protein
MVVETCDERSQRITGEDVLGRARHMIDIHLGWRAIHDGESTQPLRRHTLQSGIGRKDGEGQRTADGAGRPDDQGHGALGAPYEPLGE